MTVAAALTRVRAVLRGAAYLWRALGLAACSLVACSLLAGPLVACKSSPSAPAGDGGIATRGPVTFTGQVVLRGVSGVTPAAGVDVAVRGDLDGNGSVAAGETVTVRTDAEGKYAVTVQLEAPAVLVVSFRASGALPSFFRRQLAPPSSHTLNAELFAGQALERDGEDLVLPSSALRLRGLPSAYTGVARVFNPVSETTAFPGDFIDSRGNFLRSAVFATVELQDGSGAAVHQLASPAVLELEIPRDSWRAVRDMQRGTDRIEVPMYAFDETLGQWVDQGLGHLVDEDGAVLPESQAHAIAQRTYRGRVFVVAQVTHFSTLNADLPTAIWNGLKAIFSCDECPWSDPPPPPPPAKKRPKLTFTTHSERWQEAVAPSTRGTAVLAQTSAGPPVTGASLFLEQYYADGTPAGHVSAMVEADGSFELPINQSEAVGEDLDDNGISGEKLFARLTAQWRGVRFDIAEGELPAVQNVIINFGTVDLSYRRSVSALCELTGVVKKLRGDLVSGASVALGGSYNNGLDEATRVALCGADLARCRTETVTDANGAFSLSWPLFDGFGLFSQKLVDDSVHSDWFSGALYQGACPAAPVQLVLDSGRKTTTVRIAVDGQTISWSPSVAILWLGVWDADTNVKWQLSTEDAAGFTGPIVYGVVPAGAVEGSSAVLPLGAGDALDVKGEFLDSDGYPHGVTGFWRVP